MLDNLEFIILLNNLGLRCILVLLGLELLSFITPLQQLRCMTTSLLPASVNTSGGSSTQTTWVAAVDAIRAFIKQCVYWIKF